MESIMSETPPVFQESARCDVCNCSFTTFRRRHHCRSCGRTLCHEHSSNHMALPQYGVYSPVRVCDDCFNNPSRSGENVSHSSGNAASNVPDKFSRLNVGESAIENSKSTSGEAVLSVPDCKCGMPLCICQAPSPDPAPLQMKTSTTPAVQSNPRPKKAASTQKSSESTSKKLGSSTGKPSSTFFTFSQASNGNFDKGSADYDVSGEGLREAIKNSDANAVRKLLSQGVNANYCDKQGSTLLHLAALFNQTEIAFILMDHGASADSKNAQGETPLDCAPTMLQHKMREKLGR
ncbi:vacuolar protein sorting-associated protein 27 [Iris pallida]|uniref:Vacuolar protein sorting-associated protein 27 n=1 Tax=Iris pallida TaxID=29817 RepID=A0AAX6EZ42_IRIPA|nr:vacuolar protein sorting-associated protein 27 [Iris pallida]